MTTWYQNPALFVHGFEEMMPTRRDPIDPEPLALLIIILGAAGSIASLLSLSDNLRSKAEERDRDAKSRISLQMLSTGSSLSQLRAAVKVIEEIIRYSMSKGGIKPGRTLVGFGSFQLTLDAEPFAMWQRLQVDVLSRSLELMTNMNLLTLELSQVGLRFQEQTNVAIQEAVDSLNTVLQAIHEAQEPFMVVYELGQAVELCAQGHEQLSRDLEPFLSQSY